MTQPARRALRRGAGALALAAALCGGCGHGGARPPESSAAAIASIDARLRGTFHLVRFVPEVPLEPMLAAMLEAQYATLVIRFDGKRISADSPTVHVIRAYEILEPQGDRFKLVAYDEAGVPYESTCELSETGDLLVYAQTPPWKGVATLRRAG
jgi:hypothetical protein